MGEFFIFIIGDLFLIIKDLVDTYREAKFQTAYWNSVSNSRQRKE